MTTKELQTEFKKFEPLIEQKILEFLGDPDDNLNVKKSVLQKLKKQMAAPERTLVSHHTVLKKYGAR